MFSDSDQVFSTVIVVIVVEYFLTTAIDILNFKKSNSKLPIDLQEVLDQEKHTSIIQHHRTKTKFGLSNGFFSFIIMILILFLGLMGDLNTFVKLRFEYLVSQTSAFLRHSISCK